MCCWLQQPSVVVAVQRAAASWPSAAVAASSDAFASASLVLERAIRPQWQHWGDHWGRDRVGVEGERGEGYGER